MQQVASADGARCNNPPRIKPAEASRRLGLKNRSTLKRYLEQYPELLDAAGTVDFAELQRHRADNPRIAERAQPTAVHDGALPPAQPKAGRRNVKAEIEAIRLLEARRDWLQSIGQLVDPSEKLDAATEAASALRDKLMAPDPVLCERLAEERDPRAVAGLLREAHRAVLEEFVTTLRKLMASDTPPAAAPEPADGAA